MALLLKILKLNAEELILEPYSTMMPSKIEGTSKSPKLSSPEQDQMQQFFDAWARQKPYPLILSVDYDYVELRIRFSGRSAVVRALHAIDVNVIFDDQHNDQNLKNWLYRTKHILTFDLVEKNCRISELGMVKLMNQEFFELIKRKLRTHQEQSHLAEQSILNPLEHQIQSIELLQNLSPFDRPQYLLAYACVYVAHQKHQKLMQHFSSTKNFSPLFDRSKQYEELLAQIQQLSSRVQHLSHQDILNLYQEVVVQHDFLTPPCSVTPAGSSQPQQRSKWADLHAHHRQPLSSKLLAHQHAYLRLFLSQLKNRELEIARRVEHRSWFQDLHKNQQKLQIMRNIFFLYQHAARADELILFIMRHRELLSQSTSTLPYFFRSQVKTAALITDYEPYLFT